MEMLNNPVRLERVGHFAAKLVVDAGTDAVRRHECRVHFHLVLRVAVARLLVPFVLVFTFDGGVRVELIGEVFDSEGGVFSGRGFAEASKGWGRWAVRIEVEREEMEGEGLTFIEPVSQQLMGLQSQLFLKA